MEFSSSFVPRLSTEVAVDGHAPFWVNPEWRDRFPWVVQGITGRGDAGAPFDMALFGGGPSGDVQRRWSTLLKVTQLPTVIHARQVHGAAVRMHGQSRPGIHVVEACDGHLTCMDGVLLTVAVADCVPVTLIDVESRAVALLHAGWRGTVAGVVAAGLDAFVRRLGRTTGRITAHLGPAICRDCYEVGPEVHEALGQESSGMPAPLDLGQVVAQALLRGGVTPERISRSTWCTRCPDSPFFSHRGGDVHRQVAFVGRDPTPETHPR